jgi:hypothetical protein
MRTKAIIASLLVVLAVASAMVVARRPEVPFQVSGDLSERDVTDICMAVHRKIYPPILPDLSMKSLRAAPSVLLRRFHGSHPRIWQIERRTGVFVAVIGRLAEDPKPRPYVFWGVFSGTNSWYVEEDYHYEH